MAEAVQAQAHQLQALGHGRLAHGLGQVDQDARQVEHRRHPRHHEHDVEGLHPVVALHALAPAAGVDGRSFSHAVAKPLQSRTPRHIDAWRAATPYDRRRFPRSCTAPWTRPTTPPTSSAGTAAPTSAAAPAWRARSRWPWPVPSTTWSDRSAACWISAAAKAPGVRRC
ncbi:hypothetical protein G6F65_019901 [Rhizopus arrhizus]|nr:hypothetical protein G6F65_019901 [Rhizopus arrhizus]